jgi:hypothetical protein
LFLLYRTLTIYFINYVPEKGLLQVIPSQLKKRDLQFSTHSGLSGLYPPVSLPAWLKSEREAKAIKLYHEVPPREQKGTLSGGKKEGDFDSKYNASGKEIVQG